MRHRLRSRLKEWRRVGAPEQVQRWIESGARMPWSGRKRPAEFDLGSSCEGLTQEEQKWLDAEIKRCVEVVGSWEPTTVAKYVCKAFLVPKATAPGEPKKWRLVVDLRPLNKYMKKMKMRSETLAGLSRLAKAGDWMVTWDLQDGYNCVGIAAEEREFMTFRLQGRLFRCSAVPFGWSHSAYVFCETVKVWIIWMRAPLLVETAAGSAAAAAAEAAPREAAAET